MGRILVAFHSSEGQSRRIADRVAGTLREHGDTVEVLDLGDDPHPDGYDAVVVGDSIHMAHHSEEMTRYLKRHAAQLEAVPTALFQVSMASAYQDDEHSHLAHGMLQELLDETGFAPDVVALFAGALVYTRYGWIKRRMMRSIEKRQGGDTDTSHDYDYTDWDAVEGFAQDVHAMAASAR